jgi:putative transposase
MLFRNDIFLLNGEPTRLLHAAPLNNEAWVIHLTDDLAWPYWLPYCDIQNLYPEPQLQPKHVALTVARIEKRDLAAARLMPLIDEQGLNLFSPSQRNRAIQIQSEKSGCSERTLHKDLRRYWQRGQTLNALLPNYNKSGRAGSPTQSESEGKPPVAITAGRGCTPHHDYSIYQLTNIDIANFNDIIKRVYLTDNRISIPNAHDRLLEKYYTYTDGNQDAFINPLGSKPTMRQFSRFLRMNYDIETRVRSREGDSDFEREHRKVLGTIMADCRGVGHYYEIDSTIADVFLVSTENVNEIIGKPSLYLIIDRKSRLIVGFYFGLENASWTGALECILSISADKADLCARYDVTYDPNDWPAHQVFPSEFLADRGDMISNASNNIIEGLQVTVTNLPSKRPDWKPLVECGFKLMHDAVRPIMPAYDPPSNATRRRGKHYEKDACLTVKDFGNIILNAIIAHNRREILNYDMTPAELLAGVVPAPIALWNHNVVSQAGTLTRYGEHHVRYSLLRKESATVTEKGVEFRGCYYSFPEAVGQHWFESARKKRFKVQVSFDSRLADSIYVHSRDEKHEPYLAHITSRSEKYRGLSFAEIKFYENLRSDVRWESEQTRQQNRANFHSSVAPTVAAAKIRFKTEGTGQSRSARRADTKQVRAVELTAERQEKAQIHGATTTANTEAKVLPFSRPTAIDILGDSHGSPENDALAQEKPLSMQDKLKAARARMQTG